MTILGKRIRMERIMNRNTGRTVIVPMDHGISVGPIPGLTDMKTTIQNIADGGANAIVEHKGLVEEGHRKGGSDIGLIIHLSGSTSLSIYPNAKTLVCSVEEAIKLGADAVSIHVNLGNGQEKEMLNDFGKVAYEARTWGMPLLAMMYPRGEKIKDEYDVNVVKHVARVGKEMGADIIKVSYTGSPESFREVTEGCAAPVVIAGGPKMDSDRDILEMVKGSVDAGGAGVSIGRNVFQHRDPKRMVQAISSIVHEGATVDEGLEILG
ncbi:2-amino-3,7-dideoxy-D-threo-hept-6-ulosonate synthase [Desulfonema magnum]|uniref:2-amino-3,7-dideoxy-D-threo-hept-6-ulosonate synthase n=1 Tax=Desulfonema magnum TaxID=45655 RepID=A0A975GNG0_9BACT|nr:2-amino-3,7-dideoxy-D-threo-hept-6-ulosonate synthase [Desulfonema magnum]QTA87735.1 2-amino-3,7-dideoxy-D-threo-hept-6-ulosonate synthase [Desulfonema magnum]